MRRFLKRIFFFFLPSDVVRRIRGALWVCNLPFGQFPEEFSIETEVEVLIVDWDWVFKLSKIDAKAFVQMLEDGIFDDRLETDLDNLDSLSTAELQNILHAFVKIVDGYHVVPNWSFSSATRSDSTSRKVFFYVLGLLRSRASSDQLFRIQMLGSNFYIPLESDVGLPLLVDGRYDPNELFFVSQYLKKGDIAIDVGANIGIYSLQIASMVSDQGAVYCFEPSQREFRILEKNIRASELGNIHPSSRGVADKIGKTNLRLASGRNSGQNTLGDFSWDVEEGGMLEIETTTIDSFVSENRLRNVDFIKIDVEGAEVKVLLGAKKTLEEFKPLLVFEVLETALESQGTTSSELVSILDEFGYEVCGLRIEDGKVVSGVRRSGNESENFFAIPRESCEEILERVYLSEEASSVEAIFDSENALAINRARMEHLVWLGLDVAGKSVLEFGGGVGYLSTFFRSQECSVTFTDGRLQNIECFKRRYPNEPSYALNVNDPKEMLSFVQENDPFEIVFCFGLLYHLANPGEFLELASRLTKEMFLLETVVSPDGLGSWNFVNEPSHVLNQSIVGKGCRPARDFLFEELRNYFEYVYVTTHSPDFIDFPEEWKFDGEWEEETSGVKMLRCIFVCSKTPIESAKLLSELPLRQPRTRITTDCVCVDVGAHKGTYASKLAEMYPYGTIYAFEPNSSTALEWANKYYNTVWVASAVTDANGVVDFHFNIDSATNSVHPFSDEEVSDWKGGEGLRTVRTERVSSIRLDEFCRRQGIQEIEFLKIDAQGADFQVIESLGDFVKQVRKILVEVPVRPSCYECGTYAAHLEAHLENAGFVLATDNFQSMEQERNLYFVRRDLNQ